MHASEGEDSDSIAVHKDVKVTADVQGSDFQFHGSFFKNWKNR